MLSSLSENFSDDSLKVTYQRIPASIVAAQQGERVHAEAMEWRGAGSEVSVVLRNAGRETLHVGRMKSFREM